MSDTGIPAYARTHPLTGERIADMEDRARRAPYRQPTVSGTGVWLRAGACAALAGSLAQRIRR
ncbi:MAG: Exported zinc metalloprotease YfgC precursor [uncultured Paraburkholderia sp.]|nr:MAG: Exported zinc metalloprotease YfgC precursor [uncultured Paraburkholderia sp.]CAH2935242.1 MAG: Exported zinc metalloprotease YfgC precursor [uncultured Paraburkholderia sp.]